MKFGLISFIVLYVTHCRIIIMWFDIFSELLRTLINEADKYGINFVYAISPGLDMVYGSEQETRALREKLLQVRTAFLLNFVELLKFQ